MTPATRLRLQKVWEEARALVEKTPLDVDQLHLLLADCAAADPGNTVYVDALLMNLRRLRGKSSLAQTFSFWKSKKLSKEFAAAAGQQDWETTLRLGPAALREAAAPNTALLTLAQACAACDYPQSEMRYLQEALHLRSDDVAAQKQYARALTRHGRFDQAAVAWNTCAQADPKDGEARSLLEILLGPPLDQAAMSRLQQLESAAAARPEEVQNHLALSAAQVGARQFDDAERSVAKAQSLAGGDLSVREQAEEVPLARLRHQVAIAQRLAQRDPSPAFQLLLRQWREELGRLEIATLNARCERFPGDKRLTLELAIRLKRIDNFSGAISRLEEIRGIPELQPAVLRELGECWQHLRQFDRALDFYRRAIEASQGSESDETRLARYRLAVLATSLGKPAEARQELTLILVGDPGFKDARERLDKLPPMCDKV